MAYDVNNMYWYTIIAEKDGVRKKFQVGACGPLDAILVARTKTWPGCVVIEVK